MLGQGSAARAAGPAGTQDPPFSHPVAMLAAGRRDAEARRCLADTKVVVTSCPGAAAAMYGKAGRPGTGLPPLFGYPLLLPEFWCSPHEARVTKNQPSLGKGDDASDSTGPGGRRL